jgi:hypothetical protein
MAVPVPKTIKSTLVGYQVIYVADGSVYQSFGPSVPPPTIPYSITIPSSRPPPPVGHDLPPPPVIPVFDEITNPQLNVDYSGYMLKEWIDDYQVPIESVFEAQAWILRFNAAEYAATHASTDNTVRKLWDFMLAKGSIDVLSAFSLEAKQHWIDEGLLTLERANVIWDTVPSSLPVVDE